MRIASTPAKGAEKRCHNYWGPKRIHDFKTKLQGSLNHATLYFNLVLFLLVSTNSSLSSLSVKLLYAFAGTHKQGLTFNPFPFFFSPLLFHLAAIRMCIEACHLLSWRLALSSIHLQRADWASVLITACSVVMLSISSWSLATEVPEARPWSARGRRS